MREISLAPVTDTDPVATCVYAAGRIPDGLASVARSFCAEANRLDLPGASLALETAQGARLNLHWGQRCMDESPQVDAQTRFALGSLTKMATASLALEIADVAGIDVEAPLLNNEGHKGSSGSASLAQLLNHSAGVLELDGERMRSGDWQSAWRQSIPAFPPGALWHYSNHGYAIVSAWIESRGSSDFTTRFEQSFGSLGLQIGPGSEAKDKANVVCSHLKVDESVRPLRPRLAQSERWLAGSGGAWGSANALLELTKRVGADARIRSLSVSTDQGDRYGLGVRMRDEQQRVIYSHRGATGGAWALAMWDDAGNRVALLANQELELEGTRTALRRQLFGLGTGHVPNPEQAQAQAQALLAGTYEVAGWSAPLVVRAHQGALRLDLLELGARGLELHVRKDGSFRIKWPLNGLPLDLRFVQRDGVWWVRSALFVGRKLD